MPKVRCTNSACGFDANPEGVVYCARCGEKLDLSEAKVEEDIDRNIEEEKKEYTLATTRGFMVLGVLVLLLGLYVSRAFMPRTPVSEDSVLPRIEVPQAVLTDRTLLTPTVPPVPAAGAQAARVNILAERGPEVRAYAYRAIDLPGVPVALERGLAWLEEGGHAAPLRDPGAPADATARLVVAYRGLNVMPGESPNLGDALQRLRERNPQDPWVTLAFAEAAAPTPDSPAVFEVRETVKRLAGGVAGVPPLPEIEARIVASGAGMAVAAVGAGPFTLSAGQAGQPDARYGLAILFGEAGNAAEAAKALATAGDPGEDPDLVYGRALAAWKTGDREAFAARAAALLAAQMPDGSWNGDPVATVRALLILEIPIRHP